MNNEFELNHFNKCFIKDFHPTIVFRFSYSIQSFSTMSYSTAANMYNITDSIQVLQPESFQQLYPGLITSSPVHSGYAIRGKSKSDEFAECEGSLSASYNTKRKKGSDNNEYYYVHLKKSVAIVINKDYWDVKTRSFVKKWQLNRTTRRLCFTNKWVYGVLRRRAEKTNMEASSHALEDTVSIKEAPDVDDHTNYDKFHLAVTEKDDYDLDNLFDVLDTMSWNNEEDNSMPIHSSSDSDDISFDYLLELS